MGQKVHAKGRLDKYYKLAKDAGYRARSSYKLTQLMSSYPSLTKAKSVLDLCAAPGGWLQVLSKSLPKNAIIIGVDILPIRPLPNVITLVEDIRSDALLSRVRNTLQGSKVELVVHDGAPNIGQNWIQDAFSQNSLVLSALKTATALLTKNGSYVTKIFRSKDYNKLLYILNVFFETVNVTKPPASRSVSAEIFAVCIGYKAPKSIDPKLLDAKYVFEEVEEHAESTSTLLNSLLHPEKRKKHRGGYEDGVSMLYKETPVKTFIESPDFVQVLEKNNVFVWDDSEEIKELAITSSEIMSCVADLKSLGKKDIRNLLKWRADVRAILYPAPVVELTPKEVELKEANMTIEEEIEQEHHLFTTKEKKQAKKQRERKAKSLIKMNLGMDVPMDIGTEQSGQGLHDLEPADQGFSSDEGQRDDLDKQLEDMYSSYKTRKEERDPVSAVKRQKRMEKKGGEAFDEWYGIEYDKKRDAEMNESEEDEAPAHKETKEVEVEEEIVLDAKAKSFFGDEEIFGGLEVKPIPKKTRNKKRQADSDSESDVEETTTQQQESDAQFALKTAEAYTLAQRLSRTSRDTLIDENINKHQFLDTDLPTWFVDDESRHSTPHLPISKEAAAAIMEKNKALNERPIKKLAEAKYRKQMRSIRRLEKAKGKAENLVGEEGVSLKDIQSVLNKGSKKKEDKKPVLVLAKGAKRGVKGRPKGVKGRYKMVDSRMKKELRADKRAKRDSKPKRR